MQVKVVVRQVRGTFGILNKSLPTVLSQTFTYAAPRLDCCLWIDVGIY